MIANIPIPQKNNHKLQGEFYPLQKPELLALKRAKLINNTAFVHLALRYENPFCDRPIQINPKEFSLAWNIPESSVYEAIGKLKKLGILLFKKGKVMIEWVVDSFSNSEVHSQQQEVNENPDPLWDSRKNSEIPEEILRSQKKLRDSRKNSEIPENQELKELPDNKENLSQTRQTDNTFYTLQNQSEKKIQTITDIQEDKTKQETFSKQASNNNAEVNQKPENLELENKFPSSSTKELPPDCKAEENPSKRKEKPKPQGKKLVAANNSWLPDGPWIINGKLNAHFHEWLAKEWAKEYGYNLSIAKANVIRHFKKDEENIKAWWAAYHEQYMKRVDNIKTRLDHNCHITPEEKEFMVNNRQAAQALPFDQQLTATENNTDFWLQPTNSNQSPVNNNQLSPTDDELPVNNSSNDNLSDTFDTIEGEVIENASGRIENVELTEYSLDDDFWDEIKTKDNEEMAALEANYLENNLDSLNIADGQLQAEAAIEDNQRESNNNEVTFDEVIDTESQTKSEIQDSSCTVDSLSNGEKDGKIQHLSSVQGSSNEVIERPIQTKSEIHSLSNKVTSDEEKDSNLKINSSVLSSPNSSPTVTDEFGCSVRYQDFTGIAERQSKEISAEQQKKVVSMISDFLNSFKQQKDQEKAEAEAEAQKRANEQLLNDLVLLNQDLTCPVLRKDSSTQIRVKQYLDLGYQADYDEDGYVQNVYGGEANV